MKLKKVALLAEVLGGLGIIVSIIYLAFEISENSDAQLVANQLALSERTQSLNSLITDNRQLGDLISKARMDVSSLTPGEIEQVKMFVYSKMQIWEDAYVMTLVEHFPDSYWTGWNTGMCEDVSDPGFADLWARDLHKFHSGDFIQIVNECFSRSDLSIAPIESGLPISISDH